MVNVACDVKIVLIDAASVSHSELRLLELLRGVRLLGLVEALLVPACSLENRLSVFYLPWVNDWLIHHEHACLIRDTRLLCFDLIFHVDDRLNRLVPATSTLLQLLSQLVSLVLQ